MSTPCLHAVSPVTLHGTGRYQPGTVRPEATASMHMRRQLLLAATIPARDMAEAALLLVARAHAHGSSEVSISRLIRQLAKLQQASLKTSESESCESKANQEWQQSSS